MILCDRERNGLICSDRTGALFVDVDIFWSLRVTLPWIVMMISKFVQIMISISCIEVIQNQRKRNNNTVIITNIISPMFLSWLSLRGVWCGDMLIYSHPPNSQLPRLPRPRHIQTFPFPNIGEGRGGARSRTQNRGGKKIIMAMTKTKSGIRSQVSKNRSGKLDYFCSHTVFLEVAAVHSGPWSGQNSRKTKLPKRVRQF